MPVTLAASCTSISWSKTQVTIQHWDMATEIGIIFGRHNRLHHAQVVLPKLVEGNEGKAINDKV